MHRNIEALRRDTPATISRVHLNNAGTSLSPLPVVQTVKDYLDLEQQIGGYEAELLKAVELDAVYDSLAALIGARRHQIALTQNATRSWDMVFYALALEPGDKILTCRSEYASNYISFLQRQKVTGVEIVVLDDDEYGAVCPDSLKANLDDRVKLVAINHIPTNGGLVQPAEEFGNILQDHPAFYLLDACQSIGQLPIDVGKLHCDALTATSRKYLRGPRGIGFLYVSEHHIERLEPPFLDLHAATWTEPGSYRVRSDARRFETYEIFVAGKLGIGRAADYALGVGLEWSWNRLSKLASQARCGLAAIDGVTVHDLGKVKGGIVTFTVEGISPQELRRELFLRGTNIWTCTVRSARLDMEARGLNEVARASFHYYNTETEVEQFLAQVEELSRSKMV
jgi:cysteine desulfurase / selenocysteine lyase